MFERRLMRLAVVPFFVLAFFALPAASPAVAQGGWVPITGASPAPAAAPTPAPATPGKANAAAPGSRDYYAFYRQWIEQGGKAQEKKYNKVIDYLKSVGIDPYAWSGKLVQKPRMAYGGAHRWLGDNDTCATGSIEQPIVPIVFDNVYYGLPDGEKVYVFGMIGGDVTFGPLGQAYCDGEYCPPIKIDGHSWLLKLNSRTFRDCARYAETTLVHIGMPVKLLHPREAFRNNPTTAFVTSTMFNGKPQANWKTFAELVRDMMQQ